ncbi:hypothetical protein SAMN04487866_10942 [Thermoactinomyces sp. DSM 45891]|nr:hypothetical protein SAMN04487866_10942 [Thermoactinomyces sp. DSM 45891]
MSSDFKLNLCAGVAAILFLVTLIIFSKFLSRKGLAIGILLPLLILLGMATHTVILIPIAILGQALFLLPIVIAMWRNLKE